MAEEEKKAGGGDDEDEDDDDFMMDDPIAFIERQGSQQADMTNMFSDDPKALARE